MFFTCRESQVGSDIESDRCFKVMATTKRYIFTKLHDGQWLDTTTNQVKYVITILDR